MDELKSLNDKLKFGNPASRRVLEDVTTKLKDLFNICQILRHTENFNQIPEK